MRFLPTRVHGVLDYLMGALLIASPWLIGFDRGGAETWVPVILGVGALLYSLMTNYEMGVMRVIPMSGHLTLDFMSGVVLATSPWLFGFSEYVTAPHLILGLFEIGAALMTKTQPAFATNRGLAGAHGHTGTHETMGTHGNTGARIYDR